MKATNDAHNYIHKLYMVDNHDTAA